MLDSNILEIMMMMIIFFGYKARHAGVLVPQPGIEPVSLALEAQSLSHWTTREVLWKS